MVEILEQLNYFLALGTVFLQIVTVVLIVDYFFFKAKYLGAFVRTYAYVSVFLVAFFGSALTLVYSEIFGVIPCGLCWFERVMLYSQAIIFGIAIFTKDKMAALYGIVFSIIGAVISLYHHYLQMGGSAVFTCPAAGEGADCAVRHIFEFGYVTFPLMAFSLFVFIIITLVIYRSSHTRMSDDTT